MSEKKRHDDIFAVEKIYPNPSSIFSNILKSIEEIKNDCLFVLDTNSLVVPYSISTKSLPSIEKLFKSLISNNRMFIPEQVTREFASVRTRKLTELYSQLTKKRDGLQNVSSNRYPLLESHSSYKDLFEIEHIINEQVKNYRQKIGDLIGEVSRWHWNDPVSLLYNSLFVDSIIIKVKQDREEISKDFEYRVNHSIPPGYKDKGKEDTGIGDYLVWLSILELGESSNSDIIFVSGDEKTDWFHKADSKALYPRFELVEEFARKSSGKSFQIMSFSDFLELIDADTEIVNEARIEEVVESTSPKPPNSFKSSLDEQKSFYEETQYFGKYQEVTENIATNWLLIRFPVKWFSKNHDEIKSRINIPRSKLDLLFATSENLVGVDFVIYRQDYARRMPLSYRLYERSMEAYYTVENSALNYYIIFQIFPSEKLAVEAVQQFRRRKEQVSRVNYLFAFTDSALNIQEVYSDLPQDI